MLQNKIPKIIHYCWLSGDAYPAKIQQCIASWKKYLPDYELILWDTTRFNMEGSLWVKQAFERRKYAFAADYIRLYALYHYGGIYLDSDVEVCKDFSDLLDLPYFACTEGAGIIEAGAFGAVKGVDWIKDCLDHFDGRPFVMADGTLDMLPLPQVMMRCIQQKYTTQVIPKDEYLQVVPDFAKEKIVYMLPKEYFCAKDMGTGVLLKTDETYCIHHFEMSWLPFSQTFLPNLKRKMMKIFGVKNVNSIIDFFGLRKNKP